MQARLTATDLACRRGERLLFRGLDLAINVGEAVLVQGPNGIGKSSLLRLLAGFARPFAGRVERRGTLGMVDERPALDGALPLGRALRFWTRIDGGDDAEALARLGLGALRDVPVRFLSTGQRKRASLARLVAQGADTWLLDEPLSALDTASQTQVADLVAAHNDVLDGPQDKAGGRAAAGRPGGHDVAREGQVAAAVELIVDSVAARAV